MPQDKTSSNKTFEYSIFISEVMESNEKFLYENAKLAYEEVVELINDAVDHTISFVEKRKSFKEDYVRSCMINYVHHILMPQSYGMLADLLLGNLVACFMELRLMFESLVKSYLADLKYLEPTFFQEKLELLEKESKSISSLMKKFGKEAVAFWGKLSKDWLHTKGVIDKIVGEITEKSNVPAWALAIPMNYNKSDLGTIDELCKRTSEFRHFLKIIIEKWEREFVA